MNKYLSLMIFSALSLITMGALANDCDKDTTDSRGTMKPWNKGAWETGKYRNVFAEAGYKQEDIDAKLTKAYHDIL